MEFVTSLRVRCSGKLNQIDFHWTCNANSIGQSLASRFIFPERGFPILKFLTQLENVDIVNFITSKRNILYNETIKEAKLH